MKNKTKTELKSFKNKLMVFFLVGSIIIASLGWIFYGENAFKIILSSVLLFAAILYLADFMKRKKSGSLIAALFFLTAAFTLLITFYLSSIFSLVSGIISFILFITLIYTFFNREKYY